jgi:hypothetical protein
MVSYHRMLLHRLADIFGLMHESVGEGDYRHLILERCQDSSIPPILVSDILKWQYGETQSPGMYHLHSITEFVTTKDSKKSCVYLPVVFMDRCLKGVLSESQLFFII